MTRVDTLIALIKGDPERTHGARLPGEFEQAHTRANVRADDLDLLAVASGPGAFTGLRIGLAAIQGLAMVLEIDVVGVSALDALAFDAWPRLDHPDATDPVTAITTSHVSGSTNPSSPHLRPWLLI